MTSVTDTQILFQAQNALSKIPDQNLTSKAKTIAQAKKVAQDFESVFISQMLQPLFQNLGAEKPFGGGSSEAMWRSMQVDEYGKAISKAGGIGIADAVFREILKMQEIQ